MSKEHSYTNGEVTILWQKDRCIHSTLCWKGLPSVFQPGKRPWITPEGVGTEQIIDQVRKCPSGALSYRMNDGSGALPTTAATERVIEATPNGPLVLQGPCTVKHADGREETHAGKVALCRCGASANKPYCDGSHRRAGFSDQ
jgi:uncharacterized Fe-S cluster protein YjdI